MICGNKTTCKDAETSNKSNEDPGMSKSPEGTIEKLNARLKQCLNCADWYYEKWKAYEEEIIDLREVISKLEELK
jgi:hypothetical protein